MTEASIFAAALEKPAGDERTAYLAEVCAGDDKLRRRVQALLRAHASPDEVLDPTTIQYPAISERPGMMIGPYKLLQQIGEGGFGVVFMAEQAEPIRRKVALKIIKPGMDTAQVIARFESERQALAIMDHPHIARVLDAGATGSGRPYFVMELVKGVPITEFCDQNHLPPDGRLKLFVDVCRAIQHAHHKGVIHRDVKPTNVLVTLHDGVPVVKVIDFGVAKATAQLTEKSLFTAYGQMIGTPAYMSPEQAEMSGLDIDTRSDVYSLGVLLYELLTGTTPLDSRLLRKAGYAEMQRLIREEESPRPSTRLSSLGDSATVLAGNRGLDVKRLVRLLAGDLDWIVMKALEKDRNRRYGSPDQFAADVERYLAKLPVDAHAPSFGYRARKFLSRNRGAAAAVAVVVLALVAGVAGTVWQAVRATQAGARANRERDEKQAALDEVRDANRQAMAALRTLTDESVEWQMATRTRLNDQDRAFLETVLAQYEQFAKAKGDTTEARTIQSEGHLRVGVIRKRLGEFEPAVRSLEEARALYQQLAREDPAAKEPRRGLAAARLNLGVVLNQMLRPEAVDEIRRAADLFEQLTAEFPDDTECRRGLAVCHTNLGQIYTTRKNWDRAEAELRLAQVVLEKLAADEPKRPAHRLAQARCHAALGELFLQQKQGARAVQEMRLNLTLCRQLAERFPTNPEYRQFVATSHIDLGVALSSHKDASGADAEYRAAHAVFRQLAADYPTVPIYRLGLAQTHHNLGDLFTQHGRWADAEAENRLALTIRTQLAADFPNVPEYRYHLARTHVGLGVVLGRQGKRNDAQAHNRSAIADLQPLADKYPNNPDYARDLIRVYNNLGMLLGDSGNLKDAEPEFRRALDAATRLAARYPAVAQYRRSLAESHHNLGVFLHMDRRPADATAEVERGLALRRKLLADYPDDPVLAADVGASLSALARYAQEAGRLDTALEYAAESAHLLTGVLKRQPSNAIARQFMAQVSYRHADLLMKQKRFAEALTAGQPALSLATGPDLLQARCLRVLCLVRIEPARAMTEAEALVGGERPNPHALYDVACVFAVGSTLVRDPAEKERAAARAVALLEQARTLGHFRDAERVNHMQKDTDLDPLRGRDDYRKLLKVIGAKPADR